jgi:hypothetical protein
MPLGSNVAVASPRAVLRLPVATNGATIVPLTAALAALVSELTVSVAVRVCAPAERLRLRLKFPDPPAVVVPT